MDDLNLDQLMGPGVSVGFGGFVMGSVCRWRSRGEWSEDRSSRALTDVGTLPKPAETKKSRMSGILRGSVGQ